MSAHEPNYHNMSKHQLIKSIHAWRNEAKAMAEQYNKTKSAIESQHLFAEDDVWFWSSEDDNDLDSMGNDMRVVISARALKDLIRVQASKLASEHSKASTEMEFYRDPLHYASEEAKSKPFDDWFIVWGQVQVYGADSVFANFLPHKYSHTP